jgi:uncharacterized FlgJ-related protein
MYYTYCKKRLTFNKVKPTKIFKVILGVSVLFLITFSAIYSIAKTDALETKIVNMPTEEKVIIINSIEADLFDQGALVKEIKRLNIRYPHIVLAQSMIESGHFESNIFRANHNLFGMKQARQRATTALGTNLNHAYYNNWRESVMDYALFQSAYLRDLKTEKSYLLYLDKNYAMAPNYDKAVVTMVEKYNLKDLF